MTTPTKTCAFLERCQDSISKGHVSPLTQAAKRQRNENPNLFINLWKITNEGHVIGCVIDGGYPISDLFSGGLSEEKLQFLVPYESNQTSLVSPLGRGKLLNALEALNIIDEIKIQPTILGKKPTLEQVTRLKHIFLPAVSMTGVTPASRAVWCFSAFQYVEQSDNTAANFEEDVFKPILSFLTKTRRTSDPNNNGKLVIPDTIEDALKLFDTSPEWNLVLKSFDLDTIAKLDIFQRLSEAF